MIGAQACSKLRLRKNWPVYRSSLPAMYKAGIAEGSPDHP